jgi:uncharacterized Rmd1/YagE family protein
MNPHSAPVLIPSSLPAQVELVADYFQGQLDTRLFRQRFPHYPVLSANPLVIEPERGAYVYLGSFGSVVFWNCSEALLRSLQADLAALGTLQGPVERVRDRLVVQVGGEADLVGFSEVRVRELTLDRLKIISLALAQSVALEHFEDSVGQAMARFEPVVRGLWQGGRFSLPHREVLKLIGFTLEVRKAVLQDLTLFDDPPEAWESQELASLDSDLYLAFNLDERLSAMQHKLTYLSDAAAQVLGILSTSKSHRLEWIVIWLIAAEILFFFGEKLPLLFR